MILSHEIVRTYSFFISESYKTVGLYKIMVKHSVDVTTCSQLVAWSVQTSSAGLRANGSRSCTLFC